MTLVSEESRNGILPASLDVPTFEHSLPSLSNQPGRQLGSIHTTQRSSLSINSHQVRFQKPNSRLQTPSILPLFEKLCQLFPTSMNHASRSTVAVPIAVASVTTPRMML